jgi:hypothetical protein
VIRGNILAMRRRWHRVAASLLFTVHGHSNRRATRNRRGIGLSGLR